jgi:hypothetical protein
LTEDHGVCLSSCLGYWEDDLILQAFSRALILAPEIYANPWLLRDDEFPKLARIYNLYRRYRDRLIHAVALTEDRYGLFAVSRGDESMRFLTLRNLTWEPKTYKIRLDETIGLNATGDIELRRLHPSERIVGRFSSGDEAEIVVPAFRSCLLMATAGDNPEIGVEGVDYEVVCDKPDRPIRLRLLGFPGARSQATVKAAGREIAAVEWDEERIEGSDLGRVLTVEFPGSPLSQPYHRKLGMMQPIPAPEDSEALYEATCFAGDNNALEIREWLRSGPSKIPQVRNAREAFFGQEIFRARGLWDRGMFDGDEETFFKARPEIEKNGLLRVDFGEPVRIDTLVLRAAKGFEATPGRAKGEFSADLKSWTRFALSSTGCETIGDLPTDRPLRYLRLSGFPEGISEIEGFYGGQPLDRSAWRASNLFRRYADHPAVAAWSASFTLEEAAKGSYLAVAVNGRHGVEGAYAALRIGDAYVGSPRRAISYPSNVWEWYVRTTDSHYTYYFPVPPEWVDREIEAVVLALRTDDVTDREEANLEPEVWITAYPIPYESKELILTLKE